MRVERKFGKFFTSSLAALCLACLPACSFFKFKKPAPEPTKAEVVPSKPVEVESAPVATIVPEPTAEPAKPAMPEDGLRLPDMLTMPQDSELKASTKAPVEKSSVPAPVVARPPADAVVKPKAEEPTPE